MSENLRILEGITRDIEITERMAKIAINTMLAQEQDTQTAAAGAILHVAMERLDEQIELLYVLQRRLAGEDPGEQLLGMAKPGAVELDISYQAGTDVRGGGRDAAGKSGAEGVQDRAGAPGVHE